MHDSISVPKYNLAMNIKTDVLICIILYKLIKWILILVSQNPTLSGTKAVWFRTILNL